MAVLNQWLRKLPTLAKRPVSSQSNRSPLPFEAIPGPKPLPLIGNIWRYLPVIGEYKPDTLFENAVYNKKRYGPIVREELPNNTILHLFDPQDIESFIRQDSIHPHRRSHRALLKYRQNRLDLYRDGGLFPENGDRWYRQRSQFQQRLLSKSYVSKNLTKLDTVSLNAIQNMKKLAQSNSAIISNFDYWLYRWALGNSLAIFLDSDINQMDDSVVEELLQELHKALQALDKTEIQTEKWIKEPNKCPHYQRLVSSQEFMYEFVSKHIMNHQSLKDSYLRDWLHVDKLDRRDVISFVIDSLLAGLHTTSYTTAFLLYHISRNETLQADLRKEVMNHVADGESITTEKIEGMQLLRDSLKETLRLNPISIGTGRLTSQEGIVIRGYKIPKGVMVITQNQVISRDENIYPQPNDFKPERWSSYRTCQRELKPSPFATLPFGFGARSCIGQRIAELQIKILTARLLQSFEVTYNTEIPTKTTLIHNLNGPFEVEFKQLG